MLQLKSYEQIQQDNLKKRKRQKEKQLKEFKQTMKKTLLSFSIAAMTLTTFPTNQTQAMQTDNIVTQMCKQYKKCDSVNVYLFKALNSHYLQDLTYYDCYEISKKKLKKGHYYNVVYFHDHVFKIYEVKPTSRKQKTMLQYSYKAIKDQQTLKQYKPKLNIRY